MKNLHKILSLLLLSLFLAIGTNSAFATIVTVTLVDENGTALANYPPSASEMSYKYRNPSWTYGPNLQTDGNGQFTVNIINDPSWDGKITLTLHQVSKEMVVTTGAVTFQADKVNFNLKNPCTGLLADASGGTFAQGGGHWYDHGTTAGTGTVSFYTFPANIKLRMTYNWKSLEQTSIAIVAGVNDVDFLTTNVTISESVQYQTSGWPTVTFPIELLQGNHNLKIDGVVKTIEVSGCYMAGGFITLVDELENPMANYPADYSTEIRNLKYKYRCGGSWGPETSFQTDANGQTFYSISCASNNWDNKITMTLNQTTTEQDVTVNSVFQAAKVNTNLKTCDGLITDAPGGTVAQGGGFWYTHGTIGATGTVSLYTFPGSIKLRMQYNHGTQEVVNIPITAGTNEFDFTTTAVTLTNTGDIKSNKGGTWWYFDKPTMNLLPGDYNFWFQDGSIWNGPIEMAVSGCFVAYEPVFNLPPIAICQNVTVDADGDCDAMVFAEAVDDGSSDPDEDPISFELSPEGPYPIGVTEVTLTVTDDSGESDACTATITVVDNTPPVITTISVEIVFVIWPPNHKYVTYGMSDFVLSVDENCETLIIDDVYITKATSDEPENAEGEGDGNTLNDIIIADDCKSIQLRKERQGDGNGRVYTIHLELDDGNGNLGSATCQVQVPHNNGETAIDDGPIYTVLSNCYVVYQSSLITDVDNENVELKVYPNPFMTSVNITFSIEKEQKVVVAIYDITGKLVKTLVDQNLSEGDHKVTWNSQDQYGGFIQQGVYIIKLITANSVEQKTIIKMR